MNELAKLLIIKLRKADLRIVPLQSGTPILLDQLISEDATSEDMSNLADGIIEGYYNDKDEMTADYLSQNSSFVGDNWSVIESEEEGDITFYDEPTGSEIILSEVN